jgi:hypothetical protein
MTRPDVSALDPSQQRAASIVGSSYLLAMALGIFSEVIRGHLIVADNAVDTARNILSHETLFRLSIASDLIVPGAIDIALIAALYVVLKPVNQNLASFAVLLRLMDSIIGVVVTLSNFDALRLLSGADYLKVFDEDRLFALARLSIGAHGSGFNVLFVFLGLGSSVFSYLWFKSNYIPKALAILGVFGSLLMAVSCLMIIIFPHLADLLSPAYMAPLGLFEITMGFWLLIKGLKDPGALSPTRVGIRAQ